MHFGMLSSKDLIACSPITHHLLNGFSRIKKRLDFSRQTPGA